MSSKETKDTAIYTAFDDHKAFDPAEPEKNLLRAILTTAMADLKKQGEPRRKALEFFLDNDDDYIFSFQSICGLLDLNPNSVLVVTGLQKRENKAHSDSLFQDKLESNTEMKSGG
jgi:hypothetical protein